LRGCSWNLTSGWFAADTPDGPLRLSTRLPGSYNASNALAAIAACRALGIDMDTVAPAIARTPGVPGRFELIDEGQPFDVIVDFAHSPDAIGAVLKTLRKVVASRSSRLHALISASGVHSDGVRVPMGVAAGRLADRVIVTEGNQRGYPLSATVGPLVAGARSTGNRAVELIAQRRAAIHGAIASARSGDVVAILGRGSMPRLLTGPNGEGQEFDDRVIAREAILARGAGHLHLRRRRASSSWGPGRAIARP
jgi:UDP-N-acetylmuramoyl-L-alanyl-D-glutamate--2,6-diaminopimelate ligase